MKEENELAFTAFLRIEQFGYLVLVKDKWHLGEIERRKGSTRDSGIKGEQSQYCRIWNQWWRLCQNIERRAKWNEWSEDEPDFKDHKIPGGRGGWYLINWGRERNFIK